MKTKALFFMMVSLMVLGMGSCKKATYLNADKESVSFSRQGGNQVIKLSCDVPNFNVESCAEWAEAVVLDSVVTVSVPVNESGAARDGELVITSGEQKVTIKLHQAYVATKLNVTPTSVTIPKEGGTQEVTVETDGDVQVSAPEFVTANYADGKLIVSAQANVGGTQKGDIILTADQFSTTVNVVLEGNVCPTCGGTGKIKCSKCGGSGITERYIGEGGYMDYHGCTKCGGRHGGGFVGADGWPDYQSPRKGFGKMKCPTCGGTGK